MSRDTTKINLHNFKVMHRAPATGDYPPADLAAWDTFIATFTDLGITRKKTVEWSVKKAAIEVMDDNRKKTLSYDGELKGILLQASKADITSYDAIDGIAQDVLLLDENSGRAKLFPSAVLSFEDEGKSGETLVIPFSYEGEGFASKDEFRSDLEKPAA